MQENLLNINHQEMYNIKYDLDMAIRKAVSSVDKPGETATVTLKIDMMLVEQHMHIIKQPRNTTENLRG